MRLNSEAECEACSEIEFESQRIAYFPLKPLPFGLVNVVPVLN
jgi:hypothetical protein